jgi:hypothetical protein
MGCANSTETVESDNHRSRSSKVANPLASAASTGFDSAASPGSAAPTRTVSTVSATTTSAAAAVSTIPKQVLRKLHQIDGQWEPLDKRPSMLDVVSGRDPAVQLHESIHRAGTWSMHESRDQEFESSLRNVNEEWLADVLMLTSGSVATPPPRFIGTE